MTTGRKKTWIIYLSLSGFILMWSFLFFKVFKPMERIAKIGPRYRSIATVTAEEHVQKRVSGGTSLHKATWGKK